MSQANSSDEESDFKAVNTANFERLQQKVTKINYADGIAAGREQVFQASFDQGYADGLRTGLELAKMQAFFETLKEGSSKESEAYQNLKLAKPTDKTHFKYLEHQNEALSVVSEKQGNYLAEIQKQFDDFLPLTTDLFKSQVKL